MGRVNWRAVNSARSDAQNGNLWSPGSVLPFLQSLREEERLRQPNERLNNKSSRGFAREEKEGPRTSWI